ncbi:hypothetical protein GGF31_002844 [Allomyces arbusculus]|nr:hypothetical protein GGF31_002844 [Allomyces arbusculus]
MHGHRAGAHVPSGFVITVTQSLPAETVVPKTTTKPVSVFVTPFTNSANGASGRYEVEAYSLKTWQWLRDEPQMVLVQGQDSMRDAVLFKPGSTATFVVVPALAKSKSIASI